MVEAGAVFCEPQYKKKDFLILLPFLFLWLEYEENTWTENK